MDQEQTANCDYCGKPIDEYHAQLRMRHVRRGGPGMVMYSWHGECYEHAVAPLLMSISPAVEPVAP